MSLRNAAIYRALVAQVAGYLNLPSNWDNDHGCAPQPKTVHNALSFLGNVWGHARPPRAFVVGDGEIGLAWEHAGGYVQIGFHDDDEIVVIARAADGKRDVRGVFKTLGSLPTLKLTEIILSL